MKKLALKSKYDFREMGRRMQLRRKELKLTQEDLSEITGLSVSMISSAERGWGVYTHTIFRKTSPIMPNY